MPLTWQVSGRRTDHQGRSASYCTFSTPRHPPLTPRAPGVTHERLPHPLVPLVSHKKSFHIPSHWGNLSPYRSIKSHGLDDASPLIPEGCELVELHWLQRHGARYPTSAPGGPEDFAKRLKAARSKEQGGESDNGWKAKGELKWLNDWEYKLGREVLTPYGRSQLCKSLAVTTMRRGSELIYR